MITVYGIKNCDTVKKTLKWLKENDVQYHFHDYKEYGVEIEIIKKAINTYGWDKVINRKGTTWRNLPSDIRLAVTSANALMLAHENSSIIKRPLIAKGDDILIGFDTEIYKSKLI